jgi:FkbM family methyltransferase
VAIITNLIKNSLKKMGYSIEPYNQHTTHELIMRNVLKKLKINTVLDVGANQGQYALELRNNCEYKGKIYSFEPIPAVWEKLKRNSKSDDKWEVFNPMAIGDTSGEAEINITANTQSSSLLEMTQKHVEAAPDSKVIGKAKVKLSRLDEVFKGSDYKIDAGCYLKIDTQGYEKQVLLGLGSLINNIDAIELEVSLVKLYEGQMLFNDMVLFMNELGFDVWTIFPMFSDDSGRTLQVDIIFLKK